MVHKDIYMIHTSVGFNLGIGWFKLTPILSKLDNKSLITFLNLIFFLSSIKMKEHKGR